MKRRHSHHKITAPQFGYGLPKKEPVLCKVCRERLDDKPASYKCLCERTRQVG